MKLSKKILDELLTNAAEAMRNSYSPYSKFKVGAALLTKSGKIYKGTNIENASYGLTICAERSAIFSAVTAGEREFEALAIVFSQKDLGPLSTPCGACRQVMAEFSSPDMPIYTADLSTGKPARIVRKKLKDFYPYPFTPKALEKKPKKK
ncbi:MAG: cytidine deaminase [Elusimicrobia bacterium]|nr:cytidine deaminase [Elusimicrobiota bacterium]